MLPPVQAVTSAAAAPPPADIAVVPAVPVAIAADPDAGPDLSMAINASVQGKLNMLLLAARERMVDSLFAAIDAVSQALDIQPAPDESTVAFAARLTDTISALSPTQLATVQQHIDTQAKALPLTLIAQALADPTAPAAAQVVPQLELNGYKEGNQAAKAVVDSYGLNDGTSDVPAAPLSPKSTVDDHVTPAQSTGNSVPPTIVSPEYEPGKVLAIPVAPTAGQGVVRLPDPSGQISPATEAPGHVASEQDKGDPPLDRPASAGAASRLPEIDAPNIAASLAKGDMAAARLMNANPIQASQGFAPRQIQQVVADLHEGLEVVVNRVIDAAGPELLQIMAEGEPLADKVVAQALVADMIDSVDLQTMPPAATAEGKASANTLATMTALHAMPVDEALPSAAQTVRSPETSPATQVIPPSTAPLPMAAVATVGIPFAIAQYLPVSDVADDREDIYIDRVDPVDGEKRGQEQGAQEQEEDGETTGDDDASEQENSAPAGEQPSDDAGKGRLSRPTFATADNRSASAGLPASPASDPAYARYRRLVDWE